MAVGAGTLEELLSLRGIATHLIPQRAVCSAVRAAVGREFHLQVDVLRNVVEIVRGEARETGHAALWTPVLDYRADLFPFSIVQYQHGANEIRALRAARGFA